MERIRHMTSQKLIRKLKVPLLKIPKIVARAKEELQKDIGLLELAITELRETLVKLKSLGYTIGIFSSNSKDIIMTFLEMHDLTIFDFVHTSPKIWSKNTGLNKLISQNHFERDKILYIGDEIRDIHAAKKAGIKIAAVTWGYNSKKSLQRKKPNFIIDHPEELLAICQTIENEKPAPKRYKIRFWRNRQKSS